MSIRIKKGGNDDRSSRETGGENSAERASPAIRIKKRTVEQNAGPADPPAAGNDHRIRINEITKAAETPQAQAAAERNERDAVRENEEANARLAELAAEREAAEQSIAAEREYIEQKRTELTALQNETDGVEADIRREKQRRERLEKEYADIRALSELPDEKVMETAKRFRERFLELVDRSAVAKEDADIDKAQAEDMKKEEFVDPVDLASLAVDYGELADKLAELHEKLAALSNGATLKGDERNKELSRNDNR